MFGCGNGCDFILTLAGGAVDNCEVFSDGGGLVYFFEGLLVKR